MSQQRQISPGLKALLEYGPIVVFFVGYFLLKGRTFSLGGQEYGGFIVMTALFVPLLALSTFAQWRLSGHISKMQIVTLVLVVVFGAMSVWFNDERFFKMKPTMIYLLFGAILGFGLLRGKSYLEALMDQHLPLKPRGWIILTRRLMLFFFALAILNELIWRNFSTGTWVTFKTFGLTLAIFGFFMAQVRLFSEYALEEEDAPTPPEG